MSDYSSQLLLQLRTVLVDLHSNLYPTVSSPPEAPKRASVAVIIRINPHYSVRPIYRKSNFQSSSHDFATRINHFFEEDWVKRGDAEIMFIKRASRRKDPWSGDIALPGGRRDPEDANDCQAAIREVREEVGLDLSEDVAVAAGNLPQRIVTASWGQKPLMVLCPFIFLLTEHFIPPLALQPSEVASVHWVSLRALLAPAQRSFAVKELSYRLTEYELGIPRILSFLMLGSMKFPAIELLPSETKSCTTNYEFLDTPPQQHVPANNSSIRPLIMWGLTFGIITDFLEMLPPFDALQLWTYPTFTTYDLNSALWMLTFSHRKRARELLTSSRYSPSQSNTALLQDSGNYVIRNRKLRRSERVRNMETDNSERSNLEAETITNGHLDDQRSPASEKIDAMLEGYHIPLCKALYLTLLFRILSLLIVVGFILYQIFNVYVKP